MEEQKFGLTEKEMGMMAQIAAMVVAETQKNTPASTTLTAPALHGPFQGNAAQYGIFAGPGVRPEMFTTLVRPRSFARALGAPQRSRFTEEKLEVMTGVTASDCTNATGFCGDPPTVGQGKVCEQIYKFGEWYVKTNLNAVPQVGQFRNRADVPRDILNRPPSENPLIPDVMFAMNNTDDQLAYELWLIGVDHERQMEKVLVNGDITQGSADTECGYIKEFNGLDGQIKTGYVDASTQFACPAMDSAIITFNADVGGTIGGGDGRNIVQAGTDMYFGLRSRASKMGMDEVQWGILMREEHFRSLVENWACTYATYRCNTNAGGQTFTLNEDTARTNELRLQMMNGQYLLHDNIPVPVIFSEGITREGLGYQQFKSDMYYVPFTWRGTQLTRLEFFPMDNPNAARIGNFDGFGVDYLNNGMYVVGNRNTGLCVEYHVASKMRLILETPWLAGRIDDVQYTFQAPIRQSDPADTHYYADGGTTYRS